MSAVSEVSTMEQARMRVERIRTGLDSLASLRTDIAEAYQAQDWHTLGYDAWSSYVETEFVDARLRLPRDERRELVGSLREAGMSTRAIASATGASQRTVSNDLRSGEQNCSPAEESAPVTGLDGKSYTAKPPITDLISGDEVAELNGETPIEAELVEDEQPAPPQRRRKAITEQAHEIGRDGRRCGSRAKERTESCTSGST